MTPSPIRVLLLARELGAGGSERQLTEIAKKLDRRRFAPQVGFFRAGIRSEELKKAGVPCLQIDVRSFRTPDLVQKAAEFGRYLQEQAIQIVHAFDYPLTCFAVPIARACGVPVVLSSQRGHRNLIPGFYRHLVRMTDLLVDGIVVNCRAMQHHLVHEEEVPMRKVHLCYNGIDWPRFQENGLAIRAQQQKASQQVIGCLSVLRPEKNIHLLLQAAAPLCKANPNLQVLIVGSGPEEFFLRQTARTLGLSAQCCFQPAQKDVVPFLRQIDIFVLPSSTEAFSNSLMEAMAAQCAVIASDVGGNPELVKHGETGLLFRSGDVNDLMQKLVLLLSHPALQAQFKHTASHYIQQNLTLEQAARNMEEIYTGFLP